MTTMMSQKDPGETFVLTFDATAGLAPGEILTAITSTTISAQIGVDPGPVLTLSGATINPTALTVAGNSIAIGAAVQVVASGGLTGCHYLISITVQTSNPDKVLVLKALLPVLST